MLEASTDSEWVARNLEALGHEVIVADRNFRADVCDLYRLADAGRRRPRRTFAARTPAVDRARRGG